MRKETTLPATEAKGFKKPPTRAAPPPRMERNVRRYVSQEGSEDALKEAAFKQVAEGESIQEVAAAFGVDAQTLCKLIGFG